MCGIAGIIDLDNNNINPALLLTMNEAIKHRGPDDEGYVLVDQKKAAYARYAGSDSPEVIKNKLPCIAETTKYPYANIGMSHRRFSIIDLGPDGHQPLFDHSRSYCIVFNGEIYNYIELRDELKRKGHRFYTASDTEVLLEAYKEWGTGCFERFNGFWALALYDFKKRRLMLSRDRLGKKQLYWTKEGSRLYFASEIKALLTVREVAQGKKVNDSAIYPWLVSGLRDIDNRTFFKGIHNFPAASWALVDKTFPANIRKYWEVPAERMREKDISIPEACKAITKILEDAVRIRLRADVPWCVELSGGMDSSALLALAAHVHKRRITTYTVRFEEKEWNEEPFARSVAERYDVDYRVIKSPRNNFWLQINPFTRLEDEPYHAPNLQTNQVIWTMMRAEGTKVSLNGAGGDELFAGYDHYYSKAQLENIVHCNLRHFISNALHWSEAEKPLQSLKLPVRTLLSNMARTVVPHLESRFSKNKYIKVAPGSTAQIFNTLSTQLYNDITNTKMPYWLSSGDKGYMGIPFEARAPFLDYRLIELAFRLPVTYHLRHGWHKWILRKALEDVIPGDVLWRKKKMGFPFPFQTFYRDSNSIVETIIKRSSNPYLDLSQSKYFKNNWRVLSFLLWHEMYFNGNHEIFQEIKRMAAQSGGLDDYGFPAGYLTSCA